MALRAKDPMQIAVISDIHGNWPALKAVLEEIQRLGADRIICLGDTINPLPSSKRVLQYLFENEIPVIRGNHEDYVITGFEDKTHELNHSPIFRPIHLVSKTFDQ
ncbi:metallophosphoesterase family protein [Bdellovibrionota bacterium FG-2]